jgi:cytochrome c oxidase accessory protein FixG
MCPYARFQSAMFDPDTLIVTYDRERGEPRGAGSKKSPRAEQGLGDCVACGLCVQVCPTGIDIRNGLQYECIGCAACIDACDYVMEKAGMPKGLIRFSTERALQEHYAARGIWGHVLRPRVLVYSGILAAVTLALVVAVGVRVPLKVDVIRDRGALAREAEDGRIENTYRLQVMNTSEAARTYALGASGLPGLEIASEPTFDVPGASTRSVLLRLRARPEDVPPGSNRIVVGVKAADNADVSVEEKTVFLGLKR